MEQYKLITALRPFSLVVAIISCTLGILLAAQDGFSDWIVAVWVVAGGVLAQSGINLINDIEDLTALDLEDPDTVIIKKQIHRNKKIGIACFFLASLIAAWLISLQGWPLFLIIGFSALIALSYNMGPINFKNRGLAIVQVFLLMGVVMVQGAYFSMSGQFSTTGLLLSIPVSLMVSLLLLSNELRDWDIDKKLGVGTLTVRIGYKNGVRVYWAIVLLAYFFSACFYSTGYLKVPYWLLLPLPLLVPIHQYLSAKERLNLTPLTGRFFFLFGLGYMLSLQAVY